MGNSYGVNQSQLPSNNGITMSQYAKYLPQVQAENNANIAPAAQALTGATEQAIPQLNALDLQQLNQYALPEAQAGQAVTNSNALAGAATNLAQITGAGGQAATAAQNLENTLSPAEAAAQKGSTAAVNAIDLGGLSPGEEAATERSLNQNNVGTGNLGVLNPTNTISDALNFGGAFNSKIPLMNSTAATASGVASGNPVNPASIALGQPNTSTLGNFASTAFQTGNNGTSTGAGSMSTGVGTNLLSSIVSGNNAQTGADAQLGSTGMNTSSTMGYLQASDPCCFIFLEAYHGAIPKHVRMARDKIHSFDSRIRKGYVWMARWLVPAMKKSTLVRSLVWGCMVSPLTQNSGFCYRMKGYSRHRTIAHFWLKTWALIGGYCG